MADTIQERLDVDLHVVPASKTYPHQRALPCYGRGKRLCDILLPKMPSPTIGHENRSSQEALREPISKGRPGRGRGKGQRSSSSPGCQQLKTNSFMDSQSVDSESGSDKLIKEETVQLESLHKKSSALPLSRDSSASSASNKNIKKSMSSTSSRNSESRLPTDKSDLKNDIDTSVYSANWTILPPFVCEFVGIPQSQDLKIIYDLLSSYGTIVCSEERMMDHGISFRVKMKDGASCDEIEANFDNIDFSGSVVRCKHLES